MPDPSISARGSMRRLGDEEMASESLGVLLPAASAAKSHLPPRPLVPARCSHHERVGVGPTKSTTPS